MSRQEQAFNRSMPNQWAQSAINIYMDISMQLSNAKPIDTISYQYLQGHKHVIDQNQTNGHNQLSMSTRKKKCNYQCQTNGHKL